jgi:hypothetical protein
MMPILGIFLALCGACLLALAMVTQRYALSYKSNEVPFCGLKLSRDAVWFAGLVIYGGANGFYAASLLYGPLSLLAGVFTTLLVFNMLFSWYLLGEELTPPRIAGSVVILIGVVLCVAGTPNDIDTTFSPQDITNLITSVTGALYVTVLAVFVVSSVAAIMWYESLHKPCDCSIESGGQAEVVLSPHTMIPLHDSDSSLHAPPPNLVPVVAEGRAEPPAGEWLDGLMGVVYPGSLGVDEGIAHLAMKASLSMLDTCKGEGDCGMPIIYFFLVVWVAASVATLWWLRRVFGRFESTRALPVEYGAVNIVSVCSGFLFFRESEYMEHWQVSLIVAGVAVIACGIGVGRLSAPARSKK